MKTINYFLIFILFSCFTDLVAQNNHVNYDRDTKWNFGLNAGATWQEKELDFVNKPGFSGGLTLGRALFEKEGRLLSFDLRGRFLAGQTKGWSSSPSYDSTFFSTYSGGYGYKNYKFEYVEGSLELVVNAHRLRERTGILLYAFGGVGIVSHSVKHNYKGGLFAYDYTSIDSSASEVSVVNALQEDFNDFDWEKYNEDFNGPKNLIMSSLGLGLGYQVTPRISLGVEHKVTFGLNDNLDGHFDGKNDRYHYTNFNLRWNLFRGNDSNGSTYVPEERPTPNPNVPIGNGVPSSNDDIDDYSTNSPADKPLVNITRPSSNGSRVYAPNYNVTAKVYYVDGRNNITFKHNGVTVTNYSYNTSTNVLSANILLVEGANTFVITGTNSVGSDSDSKTINYEKPCEKPVVNFTYPANSSVVLESAISIKATVNNVVNSNMIVFKHNGITNSNFSYNSVTKTFSALVNCSNGNNTFEIIATNNCGSSTTSHNVTFNRPIVNSNPPVVTITSPSVSPYTTVLNQINLMATVLNVANASQIQFKVNGIVSNAFNYDIGTKVLSAQVNLVNGNNVIEVKGTNNYGSDQKTTIVVKKVQEQVSPPVVNITFPSSSPYTTTTNSSVINGFVYNVNSVSQVQVYINGVSTNNFSYDLNTKKISFTAGLNTGSNLIMIKGTNSSGSDAKSTTIIYKKQVAVNPPKVSYIYPVSSPITVTASNTTIRAKVLNVSNAAQIQVTHNGMIVSSFSFNGTTKEVVFSRALTLGSNVINVKGTNQGGIDQKQTIINYKREIVVLPPVVTIVTPSTNPYSSTNSTEIITARIENVTSRSQISLTYNGLNTTNFNYNVNTKVLSYSANLNIGTNSLVIRASNSAGSDSKTQVVSKPKPCIAPTLDLQIPIQSPHNHVGRSGNMAFTFSSANIVSKNQITVNGNGYNIPFNLEQSNGNIWGTIPLKVGPNTIKVTVRNECGQAVKELQVLYKGTNPKLAPPVITILTPTSFPYSTTNSNVTVLGKIDNVSSQNNVQVTMDGNPISFTYNTATKALEIPTVLSVGSHQVRVRANNTIGTDMEVFDLVRTGNQIKAPIVQYTNLGGTNSYRNPFISPQRNYNVEGRVLNNQNATVTVYVNGTRVSSYSYNANTGAFTVPISFSLQGQGTQRRAEVEVRASNSAGQASKKGHLVYIIQNISTNPSGGSSSSLIYNQHIQKADKYLKQGKLELAKTYYQKAAKANPKSSFPSQKIEEINKALSKEKLNKPKVVKPTVVTPPSSTTKPKNKPATGNKEIESWSTKPLVKP